MSEQITRKASAIWAFLLTITLGVSAAQASSPDLFGLGARGAAMAGAVVSNARDFSAVYYNPAGLIAAGISQFSIGYQRGDYNLEMNRDDYDVDSADNLILGFTFPIPLGGVMENRLAVGVSFLIPFAAILEADVRPPESPLFIIVENRPRVIGLQAALSIRITDWLFVGGGVLALAELVGGIDIAPNERGQLGTVVRDELVADYAPIIGLLVEPIDWLAIGVTFHGVSSAEFTFPITADLGSQFPIDVPRLNVVGIAQYDPMQISTDVTVHPVPELTIAAGITYKWWSAFENPIERTTAPVPEQDPAEFSNIVVPRLGAEYEHSLEVLTLLYRTGLFWEPSPVPEQTGNNNYIDSARLGVGAGLGVRWQELTFDFGFQWQHLAERTHTKDPELVRDPENPGLPDLTGAGSIFVTAIEVGLLF
ncbi:MAG: outer membrane protein transport protein [Myxococcales bacterium]|nr:outer membrane protein transport protein [Myxococcales bacterium]